MSFRPVRSHRVALLAACAAAFVAQIASAQTPPIKPGLWEVQREGEGAQRSAAAAERMKNMPPEVRAKMEAMMKERGISMEAGGATRICMSKESFDAGQWQSQAAASGCKTDYSTRSSSAWKWHSSCPTLNSETDGEALFNGPESYTIHTATTMTRGGETKTSRMTINAKWLGGNCGDLKPISSKP